MRVCHYRIRLRCVSRFIPGGAWDEWASLPHHLPGHAPLWCDVRIEDVGTRMCA